MDIVAAGKVTPDRTERVRQVHPQRSVNRINERLGYVRTGAINVMGVSVLDPEVEMTQLRRAVGMVFQRPNPSLYRSATTRSSPTVSTGAGRARAEEEQVVEKALTEVLLGPGEGSPEQNATELSLEEQQKLCIARLLPVKPKVLLMDEPCSAWTPRPRAPSRTSSGVSAVTTRSSSSPTTWPRPAAQRRVHLHADGQGRRTLRHHEDVRHARAKETADYLEAGSTSPRRARGLFERTCGGGPTGALDPSAERPSVLGGSMADG